MVKKTELACFGMGCFWGPQMIFDKTEGVVKTEAGFMGGKESYKKLSYARVCLGFTGHAEVVRVYYDSSKVTYDKLLEIFWKGHDPTQLNRQGFDLGKQYRSVIFCYDEGQRKKAEASLKKAQKKFARKIVTQIVKSGKFYKAEEYHQKYLKKRGRNTC